MMSRFLRFMKTIAPAFLFLLVVCLLFLFAGPAGERVTDIVEEDTGVPAPQETEPPRKAETPPSELVPWETVPPPGEPEPRTPPEPIPRFLDVTPDKYYAEGVDWAAEQEIAAGTTSVTFSPDEACTRAQAVTFLWRAAGKPAPLCAVNPFVDVPDGQFYTTAVLWAVENGITSGTSANRFSPSLTCTRAQIVTFLHRAVGSPDAGGDGFSDVPSDSYFALPVRWAVENGITNGISSSRFEPGRPCTRAQTATFLFRSRDIRIDPKNHAFSQNFPLYYADTLLDSSLECDGNRPYVSLDLLCDRFDLIPDYIAYELSWPMHYGPRGAYIALSDAAKLCSLGVTFDEDDSSVHLYRLAAPAWSATVSPSGAGRAFIRLEDIMADGGINGRFTHENLNRLRMFGAYLRDHTDAFYIAWIPLYVNPEKEIRNDISRDESFYNTDFVFTLDCLVADGGMIGLHGLSHQHDGEISAAGYEFGDSIVYTREEVMDIFRRAEDICARMGYTWSFFEFPHYAASSTQKQLAEEHFDMIYQQYSDDDSSGSIVKRSIGEHTCLWVPTPADCVRNSYDSAGIQQRLTAAHDAGKEVSLYFHPAMDNRAMTVRIQDDVMTFEYDEQNGILPAILRLTDSWDYRFCAVQ